MSVSSYFNFRLNAVKQCCFTIYIMFIFASVSNADEQSMARRFDEIVKKKQTIGLGVIVDIHTTNSSAEERSQQSEILTSKLEEEYSRISNGYIKIVDRKRIKSIIDELKFSNSGLVDTKNVVKLGKLAGIDIMYIQTINDYAILFNIIDIETGTVLLTKTKDIIAPIPKQLINSTINIYAGETKLVGSWNLEKDSIVEISCNSNKPIDYKLVSTSSGTDLLYSNLKDTYTGTYTVMIPSNEDYGLIIQSKALMFPAKADIKVIMTPKIKILD